MAGSPKRIVSTDSNLEADVVRQREELRIAAVTRSTVATQLKRVAEQAVPSQTPTPPTRVLSAEEVRAAVAAAPPPPRINDSQHGASLEQRCKDAGKMRSSVITRLKETTHRIISDSGTQRRRPLFDGESCPAPA